ncbi:MAG: hypothetical protein Kow00121_49230 [Elainellaceae cyanobacterium]
MVRLDSLDRVIWQEISKDNAAKSAKGSVSPSKQQGYGYVVVDCPVFEGKCTSWPLLRSTQFCLSVNTICLAKLDHMK